MALTSPPCNVKLWRVFLDFHPISDYIPAVQSFDFPSWAVWDSSNLPFLAIGYDAQKREVSRSTERKITTFNHHLPTRRGADWDRAFWKSGWTHGDVQLDQVEGIDKQYYPERSFSEPMSGRVRLFLDYGTHGRRLEPHFWLDERQITIDYPPTSPLGSGGRAQWAPGKIPFFFPWTVISGRIGFNPGDIDTTQFRNGEHVLSIVQMNAGSALDPARKENYFKAHYTLRFENGHSPMRIVPSNSEYVIEKGQTIDLSGKVTLEYTDGVGAQTVPFTLEQSAGRPGAITINGTTITGVKAGLVQVLARYGTRDGSNQKYAFFKVRVGKDNWHFGRCGIQKTYHPDLSLIPRSLFMSYHHFIRHPVAGDPQQIEEYKAAGFNAIEDGVTVSPWHFRDSDPEVAKAAWKKYADNDRFSEFAKSIKNHGFYFAAQGDENHRYGWYSLALSDVPELPWAKWSYLYQFEQIARISICGSHMEQVDETGMMCCNGPNNIGISQANVNDLAEPKWKGRAIQADILTDLYARTKKHLVDSNVCDVPIGWPLFSLAGGDQAHNWCPFADEKPTPEWKKGSDYNSWQFDPNNMMAQSVVSYSWNSFGENVDVSIEGRMYYPKGIEVHHPLSMDYKTCQPTYIKKTDIGVEQIVGVDPVPDAWLAIDDKDALIPVQMLRLLTSGVNAFRGYAAEGEQGITEKLRHNIGDTIGGCGGMIPKSQKTPGMNLQAWAAQTMINKLIAEWTPLLLQPFANVSHPREPGIAAGARSGDLGAIYISVLMGDRPVRTTIDLSQYATGTETKIERITILHGQAIRTVVQPGQLKEYAINYLPGQGEVFVFQRQSSTRLPGVCLP